MFICGHNFFPFFSLFLLILFFYSPCQTKPIFQINLFPSTSFYYYLFLFLHIFCGDVLNLLFNWLHANRINLSQFTQLMNTHKLILRYVCMSLVFHEIHETKKNIKISNAFFNRSLMKFKTNENNIIKLFGKTATQNCFVPVFPFQGCIWMSLKTRLITHCHNKWTLVFFPF